MYWMGIDFGGTSIAAGLVDETKTIIDRVSVKTRAPRPIEEMADDMAEMVCTLLARNGLSKADLHFVGVGVPCTANEETGHMEDANNLGFDDVAFVPLLEEKLGLPVRIGNDANAAAWGEYVAGDYPESSMLMVTLGTGIGGGIILNRKLWSGYNFAAGEFGHMTLCMDGVPCTCGRRGCFEAYGSASALIAQARHRMAADKNTILWQLCGGDPMRVEAKTVFDGAWAGDAACMALVDRYTDYLAEGIASLINIFQPALVCVGGGVSRAGDKLLTPLRKKTAEKIYSRNAGRNARIVLARLGNDAGILGAALLGEDS